MLGRFAYRNNLVKRVADRDHSSLEDVETRIHQLERLSALVCESLDVSDVDTAMLLLEGSRDVEDCESMSGTSSFLEASGSKRCQDEDSENDYDDDIPLSKRLKLVHSKSDATCEARSDEGHSIRTDVDPTTGGGDPHDRSTAKTTNLVEQAAAAVTGVSEIYRSEVGAAAGVTAKIEPPSNGTADAHDPRRIRVSQRHVSKFPPFIPISTGDVFSLESSTFRVIGYIPSRPVFNVMAVCEKAWKASTPTNPIGDNLIRMLNYNAVLRILKRDSSSVRRHNVSLYGPAFGITTADMDIVFEAPFAGRMRRVKLHDISCRGSKRIKIKPVDDSSESNIWSVSAKYWSQMTHAPSHTTATSSSSSVPSHPS